MIEQAVKEFLVKTVKQALIELKESEKDNNLLTRQQVADMLGPSVDSIDNVLTQPGFPYFMVTKTMKCYPRWAVNQWIEDHTEYK
ncbi:hypothetical protein OXT66_08060 [Lentilactobacillus senioris]|uniref:hypothetical protein n=1 Tax=Lentilactobacillus senioris TaxID=931534 RepID=UPI002281EC35|nr:hypothetical protein [Lentilactobacillus senioris]MCY9807487.1 hypothetical protein [Lentilactobacillus senioris]